MEFVLFGVGFGALPEQTVGIIVVRKKEAKLSEITGFIANT